MTGINLRWLKANLLNSGKCIQNSNYPSLDGYYARQRKIRLEGMSAQKTITYFLVTEVGQPLPIISKDWTQFIITAVIPSHVATRSGIHSTYQLEITPNTNSLKRKRLH